MPNATKGITLHASYVRADIGEHPAISHGLTALRLLEIACHRALCTRALVVATPGELGPHVSVKSGIEELARSREGRAIRLAFATRSLLAHDVYREAEKTAARCGMMAKLFWSEEDAVSWLLEA